MRAGRSEKSPFLWRAPSKTPKTDFFPGGCASPFIIHYLAFATSAILDSRFHHAIGIISIGWETSRRNDSVWSGFFFWMLRAQIIRRSGDIFNRRSIGKDSFVATDADKQPRCFNWQQSSILTTCNEPRSSNMDSAAAIGLWVDRNPFTSWTMLWFDQVIAAVMDYHASYNIFTQNHSPYYAFSLLLVELFRFIAPLSFCCPSSTRRKAF